MDAATIGFVVLAVIVLLIIARAVYRFLLGRSLSETLIGQDNRAAAVALGGFLLGVINVVIPILSSPSHSFWADVKGVLAYGIGGIAAMTVAGLIFEQYSRVTGVPLREQTAGGNLAAGIVDGAIYLASSQIAAGALTGDGGAIVPTLVFWAAGVAALILLTHLFRLLTTYDDAQLIGKGNVAAALAAAGLIVAIGMMVGFAVSGSFTGYAESFSDFGLMLLAVFVLYPVRQIIVQMLFLGADFCFRGGRLDHEIAEDQNTGAGLLEAVGYLATALIVTRIF
ncbi:MAG TPA: DUF350 domain-containing protein [Blastocatellia bacterium]|nr:DUF350 domain-containing protein [Blastocatellia bacterium]HMX29384.1 DUF350 domain-containing protein [Blastocatellia bacterium]HMY74042.1 DUF350 domain-containing protein [Blastocatellia bacterium]HMZ22230.1 DUF350 domain-containing protein [Blastocatellia bacterium]HNG34044.1 DUF350 domain-containing protein [Blastocatellia bacterium]